NTDSSMGNMCLGKDVIEIFSDRNEGSRDWDSPEYKDTTGSEGKKEPKALVFYKMDTKEDSDRYIAQCTYDHEAGSSRAKRSRNVETVKEALLLDVHHEFLEWRGCSREAKSSYNSSCGDEIDQKVKISLKEAQSDEEIFFFVAWVRAFNTREPIYPKLCHEFYATYEFDEVCADDELQSKKIISFRLGGRAHSLTLLEFVRRLGLYHAEELEEEGFDTYFQGGLRSDENFNAREYWERIIIDRDLHLSRSSITSVRFLILRVLHKMITYGLCQRTTGYEKIQRNDL
ncbi:hypothetical protein Tco_1035023, partial [Tanacetum coccineum]